MAPEESTTPAVPAGALNPFSDLPHGSNAAAAESPTPAAEGQPAVQRYANLSEASAALSALPLYPQVAETIRALFLASTATPRDLVIDHTVCYALTRGDAKEWAARAGLVVNARMYRAGSVEVTIYRQGE